MSFIYGRQVSCNVLVNHIKIIHVVDRKILNKEIIKNNGEKMYRFFYGNIKFPFRIDIANEIFDFLDTKKIEICECGKEAKIKHYCKHCKKRFCL